MREVCFGNTGIGVLETEELRQLREEIACPKQFWPRGCLMAGWPTFLTGWLSAQPGVGSPGIKVPDPIEHAAAKTKYSFPGQFDHVQGRLARVGYDPTGALELDYPYFHNHKALIDREQWYGALELIELARLY